MQTVEPKGPASAAGLLGTRRSLGGVVAGDVILAMNGKRIQSPADVGACLDSYTIGDSVAVKLRRATNGVRFNAVLRFPSICAAGLRLCVCTCSSCSVWERISVCWRDYACLW